MKLKKLAIMVIMSSLLLCTACEEKKEQNVDYGSEVGGENYRDFIEYDELADYTIFNGYVNNVTFDEKGYYVIEMSSNDLLQCEPFFITVDRYNEFALGYEDTSVTNMVSICVSDRDGYWFVPEYDKSINLIPEAKESVWYSMENLTAKGIRPFKRYYGETFKPQYVYRRPTEDTFIVVEPSGIVNRVSTAEQLYKEYNDKSMDISEKIEVYVLMDENKMVSKYDENGKAVNWVLPLMEY